MDQTQIDNETTDNQVSRIYGGLHTDVVADIQCDVIGVLGRQGYSARSAGRALPGEAPYIWMASAPRCFIVNEDWLPAPIACMVAVGLGVAGDTIAKAGVWYSIFQPDLSPLNSAGLYMAACRVSVAAVWCDWFTTYAEAEAACRLHWQGNFHNYHTPTALI